MLALAAELVEGLGAEPAGRRRDSGVNPGADPQPTLTEEGPWHTPGSTTFLRTRHPIGRQLNHARAQTPTRSAALTCVPARTPSRRSGAAPAIIAAPARPNRSGRSARQYHAALGKDGVADLIDGYYRPFFESLCDATDVEYATETSTDQQASPTFRAGSLRTLEVIDALRWWLSPSAGVVHFRLPCPGCGWAEKRAERTRLARLDDAGAVFTATCLDHGDYELCIDPVNGGQGSWPTPSGRGSQLTHDSLPRGNSLGAPA